MRYQPESRARFKQCKKKIALHAVAFHSLFIFVSTDDNDALSADWIFAARWCWSEVRQGCKELWGSLLPGNLWILCIQPSTVLLWKNNRIKWMLQTKGHFHDCLRWLLRQWKPAWCITWWYGCMIWCCHFNMKLRQVQGYSHLLSTNQ